MPRYGEPIVTKSIVKWLQEEHPPRCYDGTEKLEEHLKYAGKVELIARLTDMQRQQEEDEDPIAALARKEADALAEEG